MQNNLNINAVIGYKGSISEGLLLHPDNEHIVYALGSTVVVRNVITKKQISLRGHDGEVSCLVISPSGKYIASGQKTHMGRQADVIIWDFENFSLLHRLTLHKVMVQSLSFSHNDQYLASLGGQDDRSNLIIWDAPSGRPLFGSPLGTKNAFITAKFYKNSDDKIVAVSKNAVQTVSIDRANKKIKTNDINLGHVKREFTCCEISHNDEFAYCGTTTGDFLEINLETCLFKRVGPVKNMFSQGVTAIKQLPNGDVIVGSGEGKIAKVSIQNMKIKISSEVIGAVSSITFTNDYSHFFLGTAQSNIYFVDSDQIIPEIRNTCHYSKINDVAFPYNYSDLFATCSANDIRIWASKSRQEVLRITVPNLECNCVTFMRDGKSIISGWSDGKIRAFLPESGKLMYVINDAHHNGVTAIATTSDSGRIVSGGAEGEIRVWKVSKISQTLEVSLKEHRGRVWSIQVKKGDDQAVSASADGSCIVWDLKNFTRLLACFESTLYKQVLYHPEGGQLITTGSNRKITYWDLFDGQIIRMVDGSEDAELSCMDITAKGKHFVSGGEDKVIKIWGYDDGLCGYVGIGHSGNVTKTVFSPNEKFIVSVGSEGAIFIWETPEEVQKEHVEIASPVIVKESLVLPALKSVDFGSLSLKSPSKSPNFASLGIKSPSKSLKSPNHSRTLSLKSDRIRASNQGKIF